MLSLERTLQHNSPALASVLPRLLLRAAERLLYQDSLNAFLNTNPSLHGIALVKKSLAHFGLRVVVQGSLPTQGRAIYVANHPSGVGDSLSLLSILGAQFGDARVLANDLVSVIEGTRELLIPLNRGQGMVRRDYVAAMQREMQSERPIAIFPAGEVAKLGWRGVRDTPWQRRFVTWAKKYERPIVPVAISASSSPLFHLVSVPRRLMRIRYPVEQTLLVHNFMRLKGASVSMRFGAPIAPSTLDSDDATAAIQIRHQLEDLH